MGIELETCVSSACSFASYVWCPMRTHVVIQLFLSRLVALVCQLAGLSDELLFSQLLKIFSSQNMDHWFQATPLPMCILPTSGIETLSVPRPLSQQNQLFSESLGRAGNLRWIVWFILQSKKEHALIAHAHLYSLGCPKLSLLVIFLISVFCPN